MTDRVKRQRIREQAAAAAEPFGVEVDVVFYSIDSYQKDSSEFTIRLRKESKGLLKGRKMDYSSYYDVALNDKGYQHRRCLFCA